ncbi:Predicted arabinose efflux permease, MFS family [Sphingobium faniae]|nr:Predicted arabinose efflux permease, MFS family [Sphingobium faniae]
MHGNAAGGTDGVTLPRMGIFALLACGMFTTVGLFSPGLVLPQIERAFAGTPHVVLMTELVGTLAGFAFALGAPIAGALIARFGCRAVFLPALLLFAAAGAAPAILDSLWAILAARVVLGLALSAIFTGSLAGLGALRSDIRMGMFGWFSVVGGATAILLFPLIGVIGHHGWRLAFLVNLLALPVLLPVLMLPRWLGVAAPRDPAVAQTGQVRSGLIGPAMAFLLLIAALAGMGMLIGPIYAPLYLAQLGITDTKLLAVPVTIGSVAAVAASACYGRAHRAMGLYGVWAVSMLAMGAGLAIAGTSTSMPIFTAGVVVSGAMVAIMAPNVSATAMAISPPHLSAQAIGLANGVMFGAQLAFPFIAAWMRGVAGLSGLFILFGLVLLAIGAGLGVRALLGRGGAAYDNQERQA